ncbi:homeobox protein vab-15-like isoform X2 [Montipora capricornis]
MDFHGQKADLSFSIEKILRDDFSYSRPSQTGVLGFQRCRDSFFQPWTSTPSMFRCYSVAYSPYVIMKYLPPQAAASSPHRTATTKLQRQHTIKEHIEEPMDEATTNINKEISKFRYETSQKDNDDTSERKHLQESKTVKCFSEKGQKKKRRNRSHFTQRQLQYLEKIFSRQQYLTRDERTLLARGLEMTELQIRNWFQNRRYQRRHRANEHAKIEKPDCGTAVET